VSLSSGDEVPHIFTRKSRLKPGEFLITSAKRLLQQYRHECDIARSRMDFRFRGKSGRAADITGTTGFDPISVIDGQICCDAQRGILYNDVVGSDPRTKGST
jgi:hypothetical protein